MHLNKMFRKEEVLPLDVPLKVTLDLVKVRLVGKRNLGFNWVFLTQRISEYLCHLGSERRHLTLSQGFQALLKGPHVDETRELGFGKVLWPHEREVDTPISGNLGESARHYRPLQRICFLYPWRFGYDSEVYALPNTILVVDRTEIGIGRVFLL